MADNLSIAVTADTTSLTAQMARAAADVRAYAAEVRQTATALRNAGNDNSLLAQLNAQAASLNKATAEAARYKNELKGLSDGGGFGKGIAAGVQEGLGALTTMGASLRAFAPIAAAAFGVDAVVKFASHMGELGERTVNLAAAVGTTPHEFSLLTGALRLVTSESQHSSRTLEILGKNLQEAVANPSSQAAKAATSLGISQQDLQRASTDLGFALDLLADKWVHFGDSPLKTADFKELLGRGMETLVPILMGGSAAMEAFKKKAEETGIVLSDKDAAALAETGGKVHELAATLEGEGVRAFLSMKGSIDTAISGLQSFITMAHNALVAVTEIDTAADHAEKLRQAKGIGGRTSGATSGPAGYWGFRLGKMRFIPYPTPDAVPGDNLNFTMPPPSAASPQDYGGGADVPKPAPAPWPTKAPKGGSAKGAAPITSAFDLADSAAQASIRIDSSYLSAFKANMAEMKDAKTITVAQMLGFDIQYTAQLAAQDQARLAGAMAAADAIVTKTDADAARKSAAQLRVWEQEMELSARAAAAIALDQKKIADDAAAAAKKTADAWAAPFKTAFDKIGGSIETGITDLLLRKGTSGNIGKQLYQSLVGEGVSIAGSALSKTAVGLLPGSKEGDTMSTYLSRQVAELLLHSTLLSGILANTAETAVASTAGAGTAAAGSIAGGGIAAAGSAAGGGGLFSWLSGLLAFERGGIVSAAGGYQVPGGLGATPALLHAREMVLPADVTERVLGNSGGGDTHLHFHGPADGPGIQRFFTPILRQALPGLIRGAFRSNGLTPRTI